MRVNTGGYYVGGNFFSGLQNDPRCATFFNQNFSYRGFGANFDARFACRSGNGVGNRASSSTAESPGTKRSVNLTHVVMQQHVRRTRRANAEKCADNSGRGHGGFEYVCLEPLVQEI